VEIPDNKIATYITNDVEDSNTINSADADEVGNDGNFQNHILLQMTNNRLLLLKK